MATETNTDHTGTAASKPRVAFLISTVLGVGYLRPGPGTWGSLAGLLLAMVPWWLLFAFGVVSRDTQLISASLFGGREFDPFLGCQIWITLTVGALGVWSATHASAHWSQKDPQQIVIDEVSGQHLALLLGCAVPLWWKRQPPWINAELGFVTVHTALSWKYLLAGFILFRVFDIWKPFPIRKAEQLPGGWGIMADDWIAGIYGALVLWVARALGL